MSFIYGGITHLLLTLPVYAGNVCASFTQALKQALNSRFLSLFGKSRLRSERCGIIAADHPHSSTGAAI